MDIQRNIQEAIVCLARGTPGDTTAAFAKCDELIQNEPVLKHLKEQVATKLTFNSQVPKEQAEELTKMRGILNKDEDQSFKAIVDKDTSGAAARSMKPVLVELLVSTQKHLDESNQKVRQDSLKLQPQQYQQQQHSNGPVPLKNAKNVNLSIAFNSTLVTTAGGEQTSFITIGEEVNILQGTLPCGMSTLVLTKSIVSAPSAEECERAIGEQALNVGARAVIKDLFSPNYKHLLPKLARQLEKEDSKFVFVPASIIARSVIGCEGMHFVILRLALVLMMHDHNMSNCSTSLVRIMDLAYSSKSFGFLQVKTDEDIAKQEKLSGDGSREFASLKQYVDALPEEHQRQLLKVNGVNSVVNHQTGVLHNRDAPEFSGTFVRSSMPSCNFCGNVHDRVQQTKKVKKEDGSIEEKKTLAFVCVIKNWLRYYWVDLTHYEPTKLLTGGYDQVVLRRKLQ